MRYRLPESQRAWIGAGTRVPSTAPAPGLRRPSQRVRQHCGQLLWGALLLSFALFSCATGTPERRQLEQPEPSKPPDWVTAGGKSPRFPETRFLTGFAGGEGEHALERAKQQASANLANRISVRIQSQLRDVAEESDGEYHYRIAAITHSTTDVRLSGLSFEVYEKQQRAWALAYLDRDLAVRRRQAERDRALADLRECLSSAERHERAGRSADAIHTYESCRLPVVRTLESDGVIGALRPELAANDPVRDELIRATRTVDEKIKSILGSPAASLLEASNRLAVQLLDTGGIAGSRLTVSPFTYGTTEFSSAFGREAGIELERALAANRGPAGAADASGAAKLVRGIYLVHSDEVRLSAILMDVESGRLLDSAETTLPTSALPKGVALKPANFESALRDQKILAEGELLSGDLRVEVWTDKGRRGVVYAEREELKIYMRVNQASWVRLVYVLQNGAQVPLEQAYYIDASKVNFAVEYPESFEVAPPFGVEHIHATAFTRRPEPLATRRVMIDGVPYDIVADGMDAVVRTRGLVRKKKDDAEFAMAECVVAVTTTPRRRGER